jgi:hypothetical protein
MNFQRGVTRTNLVRTVVCSGRGSRIAQFPYLAKGIFMSRRSTFVKIATKAGILFGALFLVTVLIAAIPEHQQKPLEVVVAPQQQATQDSAAQAQPASQPGDHSVMPGMTMDEKVSERTDVDSTPEHRDGHSKHAYMTKMHDRTHKN